MKESQTFKEFYSLSFSEISLSLEPMNEDTLVFVSLRSSDWRFIMANKAGFSNLSILNRFEERIDENSDEYALTPFLELEVEDF